MDDVPPVETLIPWEDVALVPSREGVVQAHDLSALSLIPIIEFDYPIPDKLELDIDVDLD